MRDLSSAKIALFFSRGISLKDWDDIGHIGREIKFYNALARNAGGVYFLTYGRVDLKFQTQADENLRILPKKSRMPNLLYHLLLPFFYKKELKQVAVLKTNQMSAALPAIVAKWVYKKKLVVRCGYEWFKVLEMEKKALWKRLIVYVLEFLAYKSADKIIFSSNKDKEFAQNKFKIKDEKIALIPNYIDTNLFKPSPSNLSKFNFDQSSSKLNFDRQGIVYVGRLSKEKNLVNLIKAMKGLKAGLTLIGAGSMENELRKLALSQGVNVEFKGKIANKNLPEEINRHKIFVLPSFYEGSPKALLEAMSCGICCLGANVEGINEIIIHGQNGWLCNTDSSSINKALSKLLLDNNLREKLGKSSRQTILNNFSLDYILNKELNIYTNI